MLLHFRTTKETKYAIANGISPENYIELDFRYSDEETFIASIEASELAYKYTLTRKDYDDAFFRALSSKTKEICQDYDNGLSRSELAEKYNISHSTLLKVLKNGGQNNLCGFKPRTIAYYSDAGLSTRKKEDIAASAFDVNTGQLYSAENISALITLLDCKISNGVAQTCAKGSQKMVYQYVFFYGRPDSPDSTFNRILTYYQENKATVDEIDLYLKSNNLELSLKQIDNILHKGTIMGLIDYSPQRHSLKGHYRTNYNIIVATFNEYPFFDEKALAERLGITLRNLRQHIQSAKKRGDIQIPPGYYSESIDKAKTGILLKKLIVDYQKSSRQTLDNIAHKVGLCDNSMLENYFTGKEAPRRKVLNELSLLLNVPIEELFIPKE